MKRIIINENQLSKLLKNVLNEGYYSSNRSIDNIYHHGSLTCYWDFDEEDYQDWLVEDEDDIREDNEQNRMEYYLNNVEFTVQVNDKEYFHEEFVNVYSSFEEMENDIKNKRMCQDILKDCIKSGESRIDIGEYEDDDSDIDINDSQAVIDRAKKLYPSGEYTKDARGFILQDGTFITNIGLDHGGAAQRISSKFDGDNSTWVDFVSHGNIRCGRSGIDIGKEPTIAQYRVIKQVARQYEDSEFFVDLRNGSLPHYLQYFSPNPERVVEDIYYFYTNNKN